MDMDMDMDIDIDMDIVLISLVCCLLTDHLIVTCKSVSIE